jgi:phosphohistidine phosphatase
MKRLYLLRHAKSSWAEPALADFDRPLNSRGLRAAPFMGTLIASRGLLPDLMLSSPAVRAAETARLVKEASGADFPLRFDERIYEASPQTLLHVIAELDENVHSAMIVGHNPGIESLIRLLTGRIESMPTASLAVIDLDIEKWDQSGPERGRLIEVIRPKDELAFGAGG